MRTDDIEQTLSRGIASEGETATRGMELAKRDDRAGNQQRSRQNGVHKPSIIRAEIAGLIRFATAPVFDLY